MYIVRLKKQFATSEDAINFILSIIAEAGVEEEFEIINIREDLCGRIKDLWTASGVISNEFLKLSDELQDPVQKLHANNLVKEYKRHESWLYNLTKRLNCWDK